MLERNRRYFALVGKQLVDGSYKLNKMGQIDGSKAFANEIGDGWANTRTTPCLPIVDDKFINCIYSIELTKSPPYMVPILWGQLG